MDVTHASEQQNQLSSQKAVQFLGLVKRLPMDLQMVLCSYVGGLEGNLDYSTENEPAFEWMFHQ